MEDLLDRRSHNGRRKKAKKAKKAEHRQRLQERALERQADGQAPASPCKRCGEMHWSNQCQRSSSVPSASTSGDGASVPDSPSLAVRTRNALTPTPSPAAPAPARAVHTLFGSSPLASNRSEMAASVGLANRLRQQLAGGLPGAGSSVVASSSVTNASASSGSLATALSRSVPAVPPAPLANQAAPRQPKFKPTKRRRAGITGEIAARSRFGDGTFVYMRLPTELSRPNYPPVRDVIDSLLRVRMVTLDDIKVCEAYDEKGMLIQCRDVEAADKLVKDKMVLQTLGKSYDLRLYKYHADGPQAFITDHTAFSSDDLVVQGIASHSKLPEGIKFWLGAEEWRGIRGGKRILIFNEIPGCTSLEIPLGEPGKGFNSAFGAKFRAVNLTSNCEICRSVTHNATTCSDLQAVSVQQAPEALLRDRPSVDR